MAVRDRNLFAWQAYVITMAFVSVGLLLGMFFLWRSYGDLKTQFQDQGTQLSTARSQYATSNERVERLRSMLGYGEYTEADLTQMAAKFANDELLSEVEKDFAEQMKLFPPAQAANEKNLLKLPKFLLDTIRLRNEQIAAARDREETNQTEHVRAIQGERDARKAAVVKREAAEADLESARQTHAAEIDRLNKEKEDALAKFDRYKTDMDRQKAKLNAEVQRLTKVSTDQAETIQIQMDIINQFRNPDFAAPQGDIVKVANGGTEVWIDLGSDDGLRTGVPFSVIDESAINISEAVPKAKLVVTGIVSGDLCRARVIKSDFRNPVVTGDKVYSPAWRPGRTVGFALVGMMDVNGDRQNDIEQVRALIQLSGGKIDEEMDDNGNRRADGGGMTANTSFLVLGTDMTVKANASPELLAQQKAKAELYAKFVAEARQKGIIQISLDKLMGYLKTEGSDRTIPLGERIRAEDFPNRPSVARPFSRGKVSEQFQKRQPQ